MSKFQFKKIAQTVKNLGKSSIKSIEDVLALFGEQAKSKDFDLKNSIEAGIEASALLNETANEAFPEKVGEENFDYKGEVVSAAKTAATVVANANAVAQLTEIQTALGLEAGGADDLMQVVKDIKAEADVAAAARKKFGEQANEEGFDLCEAIDGLQAKGGGEHTQTESKKKTGADNPDASEDYNFEAYPHNKEVMEEVEMASGITGKSGGKSEASENKPSK